jgi:hypothetical protein
VTDVTSTTPTYYGVYARQNGVTVCEVATIGRGVTYGEARAIARELQEEYPESVVWIGAGLSLHGPVYASVLVAARDIRRGDEFTVHRHARTAAHDAVKIIRGSFHVMFTDGGEAYLPAHRMVPVNRPAERPCATA